MVSLAAPPSSFSPNQAQARAHFGKPQSRSRKDLASLGKVPRVLFDAPCFLPCSPAVRGATFASYSILVA